MFVVIASCLSLLWPALCLAQTEPGFFVSAPDVIRVGVAEKILISVHNTNGNSIPVRLLLQSYPSKAITYAEELVHVESDSPQIINLRVDGKDVGSVSKGVRQYAFLVVKSESEHFSFQREKEILLSYKSGYVFIQPDKPIYTPEHDVHIQVISLDQQMKPSNAPIKLEIRNPQDIIVKQVDSVKSDTGFITEKFNFPSYPMFGNWSVVAYYGHHQQHNTTVQFHVKDYVLPTFSVEVMPNKYVLLPDDTLLHLPIVSKTTLGKPVRGVYRIKYGVLTNHGRIHPLYSDSGKLNYMGRAEPALETRKLPDEWSRIHQGARLHIHVSVTEESSGKTEAVNNTQIMIVTTPYKFKWDKTMRYFKKGLPFEVKVDVQYANGNPAGFLPVSAIVKADTQFRVGVTLFPPRQIISNRAGRITFKFDVPTDATKLKIELETVNSDISEGHNAQMIFEVNPQQSIGSGSYLVAQIPNDDIKVGDRLQVDLKKTGAAGNTTLYMFIVSKGQIVVHKTITSIHTSITANLDVTFDMVPNARLIAYFVDGQNEVVADSVWFDVLHECNSDVSLTTSERSDAIYKPKNEIELHIYGDPGTQVALLAIDSSVYLLQDYNKLTQEKMFTKMEAYDLGCGPGGGIDVETMFMDSGVTVITNADLVTETRQDETCNQAVSRRRRDIANSLAEQYAHDPLLQTFCDIGATEPSRNSTSCSLGAEEKAREDELSLDDDRIQAFYNCCMLVNSEDQDDDGVEEQEQVRSYFPETWIFDTVEIDNTGYAVYSIATPDSATTWIVQAVGVSSTQGMCIASPVALKVQPDFFIQPHLPPMVVRREQVEIVANVFNYREDTLEVGHSNSDTQATVTILGVDGLCSETTPGDWSLPRQFNIPPGDAVIAKFNIVPLGTGEFPIQIRVQTPQGSDTIRQMLKVVPEGIPRIHTLQIAIDPSSFAPQATIPISHVGNGFSPLQQEQIYAESGRHQINRINITLPADTVPNSASLSMHVNGNPIGQAITTTIEGQSLVSSIDTPTQINGESTAAHTASNVYVMKYLKETDQLTTNTTQRLHQNIQTGITNQVTYRKDSGAFAYQSNANGSTWLTAFVNRIFCQAREFHFVDSHVIHTAMDWVINNGQHLDGHFQEVFRIHENDIRGDRHFNYSHAAMTAYVLISLLECNTSAVESHSAILRAKSYLEGVYTNLDRPFDMAIVTYALALIKSNAAYAANQRLIDSPTNKIETNSCHWEEESSPDFYESTDHWSAVSIETTGYALLAQLRLGDTSHSHAIVNWLLQERNSNGGFVYTQDTVTALQALSEYAIWNNDQAINLHTTFTSNLDRSFNHTVHINPGNTLLQQTIQGPVDGQIIVDTKGTGSAQLAVQIKYNTVGDSHARCPFNITANASDAANRSRRSAEGSRRTRRQTTNRGYVSRVNVCTRYFGNAPSPNTAVIDVGLYSGFRPIIPTLDLIIAQHPLVHNYEITNRSVIFYVKQIPRSEALCLTFDTIRDYRVGKIQPVAVRVYDYRAPEKDCVKFYHPASGPSTLASICEGQTCVCAAANCPAPVCKANTCNTSYQELLNTVCQVNSSDPRSQSTFAYEVGFNRRHTTASFQIVHMNILSAFVIGNDTTLERSLQENPNNTVREFWQSLNCQQFRRLGNRNYLVIGTGGMRYRDENGNDSFKYILDDTYIFEDWPIGDRADSTRTRFRRQIEKLSKLRTALTEGGGCWT